MIPNFEFSDYITARIKKINSRGEHKGADTQLAMDIRFIAQLPATVLQKLGVCDPPVDYKALFFDKKGNVKPTGIKEIAFVSSLDESYMMQLSFSPLQKDAKFDRFQVDRICKFEVLALLPNYCVKLKFDVQLHPYEKKDIGHIVKEGVEKNECYIKFERKQMDIVEDTASVEKAKNAVTSIAAGRSKKTKAKSKKSTAA